MTAYRTQAQNRAVALGQLVIAVASLVTAVALHPFRDWTPLDAILGSLVGVLAIYSIYLLLTGKSDGRVSERGFENPRRQRVLGFTVIVLIDLAIILTIVANLGQEWTANDVLGLGFFGYVILAFLNYIAIANAQLKRAA